MHVFGPRRTKAVRGEAMLRGFQSKFPVTSRAATVAQLVAACLQHFAGQGEIRMSRQTRRNAIHKAAKAARATSSVSALAKAGLSGFTLGSLAIGRSLFAAEPAAEADTSPASTAKEPQELQEVVVTGIRASLQRAMDIKMN